jgi:hypothetical protein
VARHDEYDPSEQPWHNRTPAVVGASLAGLALIGILIAIAVAMTQQYNEPEQAPLYFVEPTFSATATGTSTTTTQTITSTSPPQTTDINGPTTSSSSDTSSSETSTDTTTARRTVEEDDDPTTRRSPRRTPRTNVTRTLNPYP